MDPDVAVDSILHQLEEGNRDRAQQIAADLEHWLYTGGFTPDFNQLPEHYKLKVWLMFVASV